MEKIDMYFRAPSFRLLRTLLAATRLQLAFAALAALVGILAACGPQRSESYKIDAQANQASASAHEARYFISAANPLAVEAGARILERGGSAVDAAITTQAVLGLVEPQSSGLGGGGFLMHFDPATGVLETYDGREVAPASATPDRFLKEDGEPMAFYDAVASGLSVGVPGVVRMLALAHEEHGRLTWKTLYEPAIALADDGFEISPRLHGLLVQIPRLKATPDAAAYFYDKAGEPFPVGHRLKNPEYARTLRIIANEGADGFYSGEIADAIVAAVNASPRPGGMTLEDLAAYRPVKRDPVCGPYRGWRICSMAPPSSGGVTLLQILAMLERFDMKSAGVGSIEAIHLLFEASRLAYADRNRYLADQDRASSQGGFAQENLPAALLNPAYLAARAELIRHDAAAHEVEAGDPSRYINGTAARAVRGGPEGSSPEPPSTSHFVIVDGEGRVVSMTTTVEFAFGSHLMAAGMILNNQLTDFSFRPDIDGVPVANAVAPSKRPRSSMTPVISFDNEGKVSAALGSPGGPAIIGYVAKTLIAVIDWGMDMQEAIDAPNAVYPRGAPILEKDGYDVDTIAGLKALGHEISERELASGVHGFRTTAEGGYDGGADKRREGTWKTGLVNP